MTAERARKKVFVRANLRLQNKDYKKRAFIAWDPDSVESHGCLDSGDDRGGDGPFESGDEVDDDPLGDDAEDGGGL